MGSTEQSERESEKKTTQSYLFRYALSGTVLVTMADGMTQTSCGASSAVCPASTAQWNWILALGRRCVVWWSSDRENGVKQKIGPHLPPVPLAQHQDGPFADTRLSYSTERNGDERKKKQSTSRTRRESRQKKLTGKIETLFHIFAAKPCCCCCGKWKGRRGRE